MTQSSIYDAYTQAKWELMQANSLQVPSSIISRPPLHNAILDRLNVYRTGPTPSFKFLQAYRCTDELVAVFIVHNNKPMLIEDDARMFPSDTLITKLRLLME